MPKWKKATAKQATRMVGATATPENSSTSRTCSREPAEPRRRSAQTRVSRPARIAPSNSNTERLARTSPTPVPGFSPNGEAPRARMRKVVSPTAKAMPVSTKVVALPSSMSASNPSHERPLPRGRLRCRRADAATSGDGATFTKPLPLRGRGFAKICIPAPRTTGISRSRIFLRSVLRFSPSMEAALIWLPRVAASVSRISGLSTSAITRS